ncbi:MAG: zinc-dependent alcohol dehydrogenase family protein [Woeseiaceae bacterium]|nr:zinc-dependent alcohol dehydrogenase family protein [Woeseiaceae bacterium]
MKAAVYEEFQGPVEVRHVDDPVPENDGVVLRVAATGVCRSDWHGWMGHDPDITLPHVPGHEIAGVVAATGKNVRDFREGDRVTLPFVAGCGNCAQCASGNQQICDFQFQPGFTHWGSYAEYVAIKYADINLVPLPEDVDFVTAASLGCRFATSFRAVVAQGRVAAGQWVAVHGCGGVGLAAVMIANAFDARVIAIDIDEEALELAESLGAEQLVNAAHDAAVVETIVDASDGGAHLSLDALGSRQTCHDSIACLRKRGRHVQVGLLSGEDYRPPLPMELVIARELELVGSHGMQATEYSRMLQMMSDGKLQPGKLVRQTVDLERAAASLGNPAALHVAGVTVIDTF